MENKIVLQSSCRTVSISLIHSFYFQMEWELFKLLHFQMYILLFIKAVDLVPICCYSFVSLNPFSTDEVFCYFFLAESYFVTLRERIFLVHVSGSDLWNNACPLFFLSVGNSVFRNLLIEFLHYVKRQVKHDGSLFWGKTNSPEETKIA